MHQEENYFPSPMNFLRFYITWNLPHGRIEARKCVFNHRNRIAHHVLPMPGCIGFLDICYLRSHGFAEREELAYVVISVGDLQTQGCRYGPTQSVISRSRCRESGGRVWQHVVDAWTPRCWGPARKGGPKRCAYTPRDPKRPLRRPGPWFRTKGTRGRSASRCQEYSDPVEVEQCDAQWQ